MSKDSNSANVLSDPVKVQRLQAALKEAQDTVRAYDTKAQILGVGYIFAFNIIQSFARAATKAGAGFQIESIRLLLVWVLVFVPLVMFARVLYPSRGSIGSTEKHILYVPDARETTVAQFKSDVASCDWFDEIAAEIIKVSRLRDLKRRRFITALRTAAISYAIFFLYAATRNLLAAAG